MTRKDYELIARALQAARVAMDDGRGFTESAHATAIDEVALRLADALRLDNALFNRRRFLEACGVGMQASAPASERRGRVNVVRVALDDRPDIAAILVPPETK